MMIGKVRAYIGDALAHFLSKPGADYKAFSVLTKKQLQDTLRPGDLLLVEGNSRISSAIKYLTQSTWSHVCIFIGEQEGLQPLLEADLIDGVITVPIDKYDGFNLRICRPVNLSEQDTSQLLQFVVERIGVQYDTQNIVDLMRYLLPTPPIPQQFRRRLLAFGSGDPTKAICSTLVAQAFQSIRYPILPMQMDEYQQWQLSAESQTVEQDTDATSALVQVPATYFRLKDEQILAMRHYSHFTPRDFDLSPYFEVVKPTLTAGFDYKAIQWREKSND